MAIDWNGDRRAAVHCRLAADDTAVVEDAATLLILERSVDLMSFVCEALASQEAAKDFEGQETILNVLEPAWKSGEVDVPGLLRDVRVSGGERADRGAAIALEWLRIDA